MNDQRNADASPAKKLWNILQITVFAFLTLFLVWFSWLVISIHKDFQTPGVFYKMPDADFTNLWSAGVLARTGRLDVLFSSPLYEAWKSALLHRPVEQGDWIYPSNTLPFGAVLSFLPLRGSFLLWDSVTVAGMVLILRGLRMPAAVILLTVFSPAEYRCLTYGQLGGILGCFTFAALLLAKRKPLLAGLLLGVVTLKPQPGIIVPAAWLAAREWRAIAAATATTLLLAALPVLWFGQQSWALFFKLGLPAARAIMQAPFGQNYQLSGVSIFWMMRSLGCGNAAAYGAQLAGALIAIVIVYRAWRRPDADRIVLACLTVFLSLFITPYGFATDMVGYTIGVAALAWRRHWQVTLIDGLLWLWPGYVAIVTPVTGFLATPLVVAAAAIMAWRQLRPV